MKKRRRSPSPNRGRGEVKKFRKSELRSMVQVEVLSAVKQTEAKMERLLEKVQHLECEPKYDSTIRQLEAHIKKVKRRGDAAIAYIKNLGIIGTQDPQKQRMLATPVLTTRLDVPRSDSEDEIMETASQSKIATVVKKEPASPSPITSATAPPVSQHTRRTQTPEKLIKKELLSPRKSADYDTDEEEEVGHEAAKVKVEPHEDNSNSQHKDSERDEDAFPPLPPTLFPSILSVEAASYNIPQKPILQLARIRNPPGLSVLWNVEEEDPAAPPMDSYSFLMAMETAKGSGVFPEWKTLGEVQAGPLPMCVMISKYKPGYRACVAVIGKDKFGRYGPYSKVMPTRIPEEDV